MAKIYTKTGDKGKTGTFLGRMSKADELAEALGNIDELNSWIGLVRTECTMKNAKFKILDEELKRMQGNLMGIAAQLAGSKNKFSSLETTRLEKLVDKLEKDLPKLKHFVYPVGELQVARAVCRRAEREVVKICDDKNILKYMNRLSDTLFVMARWVNREKGLKEEEWRNK
jgi:cob(I)alamin adenosyltransferase